MVCPAIYCANDPISFNDPKGTFLEILLAAGMEDWLQTSKGVSANAAKNYAKNKVEHIMANYSGKILGFLAAESAEQLICQGTQLGYFIRNVNAPSGMQIHFKMIEGKISYQFPNGDPRQGTLAYDFFQGFIAGFNEGL